MFKRSVLISSFSAAFASVFMSLAFSKDALLGGGLEVADALLGGGLGGAQVFELLLRFLCLLLGIGSNVLMFKFFLTANVQADAATEVNAAALGLNCVFAVLISRAAGLIGRVIRRDLLREQKLLGPSGAFWRDFLREDKLFGKAENVGNFVCGVVLILLGVGLIGGRGGAVGEVVSSQKSGSGGGGGAGVGGADGHPGLGRGRDEHSGAKRTAGTVSRDEELKKTM